MICEWSVVSKPKMWSDSDNALDGKSSWTYVGLNHFDFIWSNVKHFCYVNDMSAMDNNKWIRQL